MTDLYEDSFTFTLTRPLKNVAVDASAVTINKLFLVAPCGSNMDSALTMQDHFKVAMKNVQSDKNLNASSDDDDDDDKKPKIDETPMTANQIMMMLSMYGNSSKQLYADFKQLITNDVCFVDPQHKITLTDTLYQKLSFKDITNLCREYLYRFLLRDFLDGIS